VQDSLGGAARNWTTPRGTDAKCGGEYTEGMTGCDLAKDANEFWKTPHGMATTDHTGKRSGPGGGEFAKQVTQWPTPDANVMNDGESAVNWRARQERLKLTANNGNGAGVPLAIAAQEMTTDE
jgi:hypothetical protein